MGCRIARVAVAEPVTVAEPLKVAEPVTVAEPATVAEAGIQHNIEVFGIFA